MLYEAAWYAEKEKAGEPKYVRLYHIIRSEIEKGNIPTDYLLPSIREVTKDLGLSSTTVENAYNQLMVEGYIYSIPQKGYYTACLDRSCLHQNQPARELDETGVRTSLNTDFMDIRCFNFREWKKAYSAVLDDFQQRLMHEGDPQGEWELRKALSDYVYRARGIFCSPGQIVIGSGVQTLLSIFCDLTATRMAPKVAFEEPGFVDVRPVFKRRGFSLHPVRLNKDGIDVDILFQTEASVCYISPSHQFPTGLVMPVQKRMELLKWAVQKNGYLLEDDYDSELRFSGRPVPSLFSLDNAGHVIYLGSFSTMLAPFLRISYMILPEPLSRLYRKTAYYYRPTVSVAEQMTLARYIEGGYFERHIRRMRKRCSARLRAFVHAAEKFSQDIMVYPSDTGTFVLIKTLNHAAFESLRKNSLITGLGLQQVWDCYFTLQYGNIPEEKYQKLLGRMIQENE